ncbi:MAG: hypothetical protein U9N09_00100 [Euryarchaeota archaeon]|nr:hypothetical protein [Euryarchaeota archaeon]
MQKTTERSPGTTITNTKRKATDALGGILDENSRVLEIGAGPGTLTIPLATKVIAGLL